MRPGTNGKGKGMTLRSTSVTVRCSTAILVRGHFQKSQAACRTRRLADYPARGTVIGKIQRIPSDPFIFVKLGLIFKHETIKKLLQQLIRVVDA